MYYFFEINSGYKSIHTYTYYIVEDNSSSEHLHEKYKIISSNAEWTDVYFRKHKDPPYLSLFYANMLCKKYIYLTLEMLMKKHFVDIL